MVRNFKGVVKVSDVQEEFDNLLSTINAKIDEYNGSLNIEDIDYNNGGPDLAPYGYTLSVGGLKTVLEAYDGAILGANVLRRSNGQYIVSEGLYIKDGEVLKLPSKTVDGNGKALYYNAVNEVYSFDSSGKTKLYPDAQGKITLPAGEYFTFNFLNNKTEVITFSSPTQLACDYVYYGYENVGMVTDSLSSEPEIVSITNTYTPSLGSAHFNSNTEALEYIEIPSSYYGTPVIKGDDVSLLGTVSVADLHPESTHFEDLAASDFFYSNSPKWYSAEPIGGFWVDNGIKVEWTLPRDVNITSVRYLCGWDIDEGQHTVVQSVVECYDSNNNLIKSAYPVNYMPPQGYAPDGQNTRDIEVVQINAPNTRKIVISISSGIKISTQTYNVLLGSIRATGVIDTSGNNIFITNLNPNRISRLCNRPNATNESIPDYKVTIESKNSGYVINGNQSLSNSEKGQFFSGSAGRNCRINLFDTQVAYHQWHGDRTDSYHEPFNFMFIPKGIPNPYNGLAGEVRFAMQKVWNYILQRPSR